MIYQWQELNPAELTHCHYRTSGLNRDGSLKHDYPTSEWRLVPLGHWNWKWNQARSNYSTYDHELLAGTLVLSLQSPLLGSNPIVWLCDQEPVKSFQKGPPPEKAKLKRWWTYLAQAPTQDYHSYTHAVLGVVGGQVVSPNDPPVKKTREHSAAKQLWPNRARHNAFPLLGLGGKRCS